MRGSWRWPNEVAVSRTPLPGQRALCGQGAACTAQAQAQAHRCIAADVHRVPPPFRTFAVRSDESQHATAARAPYGRVHLVRTGFLGTEALARIAAEGHARVTIEAFSDIDYANTTFDELATAAPEVVDLAGHIARALQLTVVLGNEVEAYRRHVTARIDYLATCGAGFHNDVSRHWSRCLFWLLALDARDVEFVMPHAGVRVLLAPGDLLVFDQTMAHGLCRPRDDGQALAASFDTGTPSRQIFLTGELRLSDAQWAAIGAPWLPVEVHAARGALDLLVASFDERSGAIQRLHTLRDGMRRSVCHVDAAAG